MQFFVRGTCTMIAAPVQGDVDGIPKGSHHVFLSGLTTEFSSGAGWNDRMARKAVMPPRLLQRLDTSHGLGSDGPEPVAK
jgi:hypothetical protein